MITSPPPKVRRDSGQPLWAVGSGFSETRGVRDESGWRMWLTTAAAAVGSRGLAYLCAVKTASGAREVQIVHGPRRGVRRIEHLGAPSVASPRRRLRALDPTCRFGPARAHTGTTNEE
jgi:hypothetical protein